MKFRFFACLSFILLSQNSIAIEFLKGYESRIVDCEIKCNLEYIQSKSMRRFIEILSKSEPSTTTVYYKLSETLENNRKEECHFSKSGIDSEIDLLIMEINPKSSSISPNPQLHSALKAAILSSDVQFYGVEYRDYQELPGSPPYEPDYLTGLYKVLETYDRRTLEVAYTILRKHKIDPFRPNGQYLPETWKYICKSE